MDRAVSENLYIKVSNILNIYNYQIEEANRPLNTYNLKGSIYSDWLNIYKKVSKEQFNYKKGLRVEIKKDRSQNGWSSKLKIKNLKD